MGPNPVLCRDGGRKKKKRKKKHLGGSRELPGLVTAAAPAPGSSMSPWEGRRVLASPAGKGGSGWAEEGLPVPRREGISEPFRWNIV